jgi:hypothetical protein
MTALDVKSVEGLAGTPVSYAYAVKAGPWVFLTGHEAFDWSTGAIDGTVSGPPGFPAYGSRHPSRREADFILQRMRAVLSEFGTDLAHAVRLDQYYPNPRRRRLSPVAARQFRRLHPTEHFCGHGTPVRSQLDNFDLAGWGDAGAWPRNSQGVSAWRCLGANLRVRPGSRVRRVCFRRRADGA